MSQGKCEGDIPFCEIVFLNEFNIPLSPDVWSLTLVKSSGWVHDPAMEAATPIHQSLFSITLHPISLGFEELRVDNEYGNWELTS